MDIKHVDLHLLMIFDAVLAEGNVTRAADRIDISQSAVSKGLAQLREIFHDPCSCGTDVASSPPTRPWKWPPAYATPSSR